MTDFGIIGSSTASAAQAPAKAKDKKPATLPKDIVMGVATDRFVARNTPFQYVSMSPLHSPAWAWKCFKGFVGAAAARVTETVTSPVSGILPHILPSWMSPVEESLKSYSSRVGDSLKDYETLVGSDDVKMAHLFMQVWDPKAGMWRWYPREFNNAVRGVHKDGITELTLEIPDLPKRRFIGRNASGYFVRPLLQEITDAVMDPKDPYNICYYFKLVAEDAVKRDGITEIRLMHEMNGFWYPTSGVVNGGGEDKVSLIYRDERGDYQLIQNGMQRSKPNGIPDGPERYIAAWIKIVSIFRDAEARAGKSGTIRFIWGPNSESVPSVTDSSTFNGISNYYPGDAWVDVVGVSMHKQYDYQTFNPLFSQMDAFLRHVKPKRPLAFPEYSAGGDIMGAFTGNPQFYIDMKDGIYSLIERGYRVDSMTKFELDKEQNWTFRNPVIDETTGRVDYFGQITAQRLLMGSNIEYSDPFRRDVAARAYQLPLAIREAIMDYHTGMALRSAWDIVDIPFTNRRADYSIGRVDNANKKIELLRPVMPEAMDTAELDRQLGLTPKIAAEVDRVCRIMGNKASYIGYIQAQFAAYEGKEAAAMPIGDCVRKAVLEALKDIIFNMDTITPDAIQTALKKRTGEISAAVIQSVIGKDGEATGKFIAAIIKCEFGKLGWNGGRPGDDRTENLAEKILASYCSLTRTKPSDGIKDPSEISLPLELSFAERVSVMVLYRMYMGLTRFGATVGTEYFNSVLEDADIAPYVAKIFPRFGLESRISSAAADITKDLKPSDSPRQPKEAYLAQITMLGDRARKVLSDIYRAQSAEMEARIRAEAKGNDREKIKARIKAEIAKKYEDMNIGVVVTDSVLSRLSELIEVASGKEVNLRTLRVDMLGGSNMAAVREDIGRQKGMVGSAYKLRAEVVKREGVIREMRGFARIQPDDKAYPTALTNLMVRSFEWITKQEKEPLHITDADLAPAGTQWVAVFRPFFNPSANAGVARAESMTRIICDMIVKYADDRIPMLELLRDYDKDWRAMEAGLTKEKVAELRARVKKARDYYNVYQHTLPFLYGLKANALRYKAVAIIDTGATDTKELNKAGKWIAQARLALKHKRENLSLKEAVMLVFSDEDYDTEKEIIILDAQVKFQRACGQNSNQKKMEAVYEMQRILSDENVSADLVTKVKAALYECISRDFEMSGYAGLVPIALEVKASSAVKFFTESNRYEAMYRAVR